MAKVIFNETIMGTEGYDELSATKNKSLILAKGGHDFINVQSGSYHSVNGGKGNDEFVVYLNTSNNTLNGDEGDDSLSCNNRNSNIYNSLLLGGSGNDNFNNILGQYLTIDGGTGNDYISSYAYNSSLSGGSGNDYISDIGEVNSIYGGAGNDTINPGWDGYTDGGDGDDYFYVGDFCGYTINGGKGNDTIALNEDGATVTCTYNPGDGNDLITDFYGHSTLKIGNGEDTFSKKTSGNDIIVTVGIGEITILGAARLGNNINIVGKEVTSTVQPPTLKVYDYDNIYVTANSNVKLIDATQRTKAVEIKGNDSKNTIKGGSGNDTLYGEGGNDYLWGYAGKDILIGGDGNDTLRGKAGNDTLTGGSGKDLFVCGANHDVITDYEVGDKISLGAAITKVSVSGSDVIINMGSKHSLTIKDGKGKLLNIVNSKGLSYQTVVGGYTNQYLTNADTSPPVIWSTTKNIDASSRTKAIKITGNELDNIIKGSSVNDSLYGNDGNDKLYGNAGNDKLYGGNGNDFLYGGKGNDSLWGDAGSDNFVYDTGDGKDVIYGFEENDMLLITGSFTGTYDSNKNEAYFKVGNTSKAITLKEFGSLTTFNVNGLDYKISGSKLVKQA